MTRRMRASDWLTLFSVRNYPNYLVVVVAALAVHGDTPIVRPLLAQFVLFGVCLYSGIYIVNAVIDADLDRTHPVKRHRPVAAGRITVRSALMLAAGLWVVAFAATDPHLRPTYLAFIGVNLLYSFVLKRRGVRNLIAVTSAMRCSLGFQIAGLGVFANPALMLLATLFMAAVQQVKFGVEGTRGGTNTPAKLLGIAAAMLPIGIWSFPSQPLVVSWVAFATLVWVWLPWRVPPLARWLIGADVPDAPAGTATGVTTDLVAFDFDGTLCDSMRAILEAVNEKSAAMGFEPISEERFREFRGMSLRQIQEALGLRPYHFVLLGRHARRTLFRRRASLEPIAGIPEALRALRQRGYRLAIVSSNHERNVRAFLEAHDIDLFDEIITHRGPGSGLWRKRTQLRKLMSMRRDVRRFVYVCDEIRDVEAARDVGIPVIAVAWGANTALSLGAAGPTAMIEDPAQLADTVDRVLATAGEVSTPGLLARRAQGSPTQPAATSA